MRERVSAALSHKYGRIVLDVALVGLVYLAGQLMVSIMLRVGGVTDLQQLNTRPGLLTGAYIVGGLATTGGAITVMKIRHMTFKDIWLLKPALKDVGYGFLGFGAYFLAVRIVLTLAGYIFHSLDLTQAQNIGLENYRSTLLPFIFIALVVLPPLGEELLFRGFLLARLRGSKLAPITSALVVSGIFGTLHGQWNVAIDTFVLSMVMIYVLDMRHSLWVSITMHFLKNSFAFAALFIFHLR